MTDIDEMKMRKIELNHEFMLLKIEAQNISEQIESHKACSYSLDEVWWRRASDARAAKRRQLAEISREIDLLDLKIKIENTKLYDRREEWKNKNRDKVVHAVRKFIEEYAPHIKDEVDALIQRTADEHLRGEA